VHGQHHIAERGGQAVRGRYRGQSDDNIADETERSSLHAFVPDDRARRFLYRHPRNTVAKVAS
jgi:hypothetical protein